MRQQNETQEICQYLECSWGPTLSCGSDASEEIRRFLGGSQGLIGWTPVRRLQWCSNTASPGLTMGTDEMKKRFD